MIDLALPPYNVVGDWNGSDSAATNNTNAIKDAIAAAHASNTNGGVVDAGGTQGDTLVLPKGSVMFDDTLVLGNGVALQGAGDYATNLVMKGNFDPEKHGIILGSDGDVLSSFGGRLSNLCVHSRPTMPVTSKAVVYSNDVQDGFLLDHVRLYGFNRRWFHGEIGYGGAAMVRFRQVTGNCSVPAMAGGYFDYGESTMVEIDGIEPSGARVDPTSEQSPAKPGTVGVLARGGMFDIRRMHGELLETTLLINLRSAVSYCDVSKMTGGPMNRDAIVIVSNPANVGNVTLNRIIKNGESRYMVLNGNGANIPDSIRGTVVL
jgi:hypothetical protein